MTGDERPFADWIGRATVAEDVVTKRLVQSFHAVLDGHLAATQPQQAPLGLHWCLSTAIEPMAALGPDGHPAKNLNLPPVPLPRRMWAGGALELIGSLSAGDVVQKTSTIADVAHKVGRSGELWFVTVNHEYRTDRGVAIRERQDIVYREAAGSTKSPATKQPPDEPPRASRTWTLETSPTLLFRYSAITFNGHRIHYDFPYATDVEGYRGLVVHGPMQATVLLNLAASCDRQLRSFTYRGVAPAMAGAPLNMCIDDASGALWVAGPDGTIHMEAMATY